MKPLLQTDPDSGEITNMKEVLEQVKTDKPFLFMSEVPAGGGQGGGGQQNLEVLHQAVEIHLHRKQTTIKVQN